MSEKRSAQDFLKDLEDQNVTVSQWCRDHKFANNTVWAVISGKTLGRRGEARRAMKLMGLEPPTARHDYPAKTERKALDQYGFSADAVPLGTAPAPQPAPAWDGVERRSGKDRRKTVQPSSVCISVSQPKA